MMNKQKTRGQLISKLQHMKSQPNSNSIQHLGYKDIGTICDYLLEDKKEIEKLERALDKACYTLNAFAIEAEYEDDEASSPNEWKEWCMGNVD